MKEQCKFNKNGSCLYYYVIESVIGNAITKLNEIAEKDNNQELRQIANSLSKLGERC